MGGAASQEVPLAEKRYRIQRPPRRDGSSNSTTVSSPGSKLEMPSPNSSDKCSVSSEPTPRSNGHNHHHHHNGQPFDDVIASSNNNKGYLSKRQRVMIENSWKKAKKTGAEHVGAKIFLMVLTATPDIKAIFGLEKIPQGRLKYDPRFRQHAQVFTKTFDYVVKNLNYPEKIEEHFEALGRRHVGFQGRGFKPQYWETFAECMTQTAIEWEGHRARSVCSTWRTLVSLIISYMRRGFDDENARRKFAFSVASRPPIMSVSSSRSISPRPMLPMSPLDDASACPMY